MAYPNAVFSLFAFIGVLMCMLPFPWHPQAWSAGPCMYMIWTGLACLNLFINSIIWSGNAIDYAPVWCDISTKFIIGSTIAIPAASLTINRRLYYISKGEACDPSTISKSKRRYDFFFDLFISLGLPAIEMALHYVTQGHRYDIFEDIGCWPSVYNTPISIAIISGPQLAIGCVSGIYGVLSVIKINKRRTDFDGLVSSHSSLNSSIYIRLMCLAGIETLFTVPLCSFSLYQNIKNGLFPWISWEDTHYNFSRVEQILAIYWRANRITNINLETSRWLIVICAFTFFAFFGFADEAMKNYRAIYKATTNPFRRRTASRPHVPANPLNFTYKNMIITEIDKFSLALGRKPTISSFSGPIFPNLDKLGLPGHKNRTYTSMSSSNSACASTNTPEPNVDSYASCTLQQLKDMTSDKIQGRTPEIV